VRLSCLQENLARGLSVVGRAVAPRSNLPVLQNILLATDEGRLKLAATNLEIGITSWIGAMVEDEGGITVPARLLTDFVNQLPSERIDMDLSVRTLMLNLKCARYDTNIKGIDASEFPPLPEPAEDGATYVEGATLRKMINQVVFAAATDDSRPTLTGVHLRFDGDRLTMAATDGFRLALRSTRLGEEVPEKREIIVPSRALTEVSRIIGIMPDGDKQFVAITVSENNNQVLFHLPDVEVVSQLIDANYPNYEAIVPRDVNTRTVVDTSTLLRALRLASLFARDNNQLVRLQITPNPDELPGTLTVTASSKESGDNVADLDAIIDGGDAEIAFNARYLIDVLSTIDEPQVALETTKPSAPGVLRPVGVGPEEFTCVIMPMHINR
jgi:DNA polymerase-3 subunit beta